MLGDVHLVLATDGQPSGGGIMLVDIDVADTSAARVCGYFAAVGSEIIEIAIRSRML
jgi:hypothetical protein